MGVCPLAFVPNGGSVFRVWAPYYMRVLVRVSKSYGMKYHWSITAVEVKCSGRMELIVVIMFSTPAPAAWVGGGWVQCCEVIRDLAVSVTPGQNLLWRGPKKARRARRDPRPSWCQGGGQCRAADTGTTALVKVINTCVNNNNRNKRGTK